MVGRFHPFLFVNCTLSVHKLVAITLKERNESQYPANLADCCLDKNWKVLILNLIKKDLDKNHGKSPTFLELGRSHLKRNRKNRFQEVNSFAKLGEKCD